MTWVAVGATAVSAYSGYRGAQAARESGKQANEMTWEMWNKAKDVADKNALLGQAELAPYSDVGKENLNYLSALMRNPDMVTQTPGYGFRMQQGQNTLENSAAARGGLLSGNTGRALTDYGQNFAKEEYANEIARRMGLINLGYGASAQRGANYMNLGSNQAQLAMSRAGMSAPLIQSMGAASQQGWNSIGDAAMGGAMLYGYGAKPSSTTNQWVPASQKNNPGWGSGAFDYAPD